ncbi:hypothetical protein SLEP1_g34091 [Rubroshorea leprosula]|uniref:Uncharacterized protein n=1 Tax=Rubroshorea leprosula TaxID=152421 RepID=A0AAV5KIP3_9ROSI|nr:hypothetical protein SLEP1_g34091 [Rubroshorea leprosula]
MSKTVRMCPNLQIGDGGGDDGAQIYRSVMVVVTMMLSPFPSSPISPSIFDFSCHLQSLIHGTEGCQR